MMSFAEAAFSIGNLAAALCWLSLVVALFAARLRSVVWAATGLLVPGLLGIVYVILIVQGFGAASGGGFGSFRKFERSSRMMPL
jgi:hypothetical protein